MTEAWRQTSVSGTPISLNISYSSLLTYGISSEAGFSSLKDAWTVAEITKERVLRNLFKKYNNKNHKRREVLDKGVKVFQQTTCIA